MKVATPHSIRSMPTALPTISFSIGLIITGLMMLPTSYQAGFYFDRSAVENGGFSSLLSSHFLHSDLNHWLWNCLAMLVLGAVIELRSKRLLVCSVIAGIVAVDILLLSPLSTLNYYCGLSGVLNSLLVVALWIVWQRTRSLWVAVSALLCIGKIIIEINTQQSLLTTISWPPYPAAHMAGALAGVLLIAVHIITTHIATRCLSSHGKFFYNRASRGNTLNEKTFKRFIRPT